MDALCDFYCVFKGTCLVWIATKPHSHGHGLHEQVILGNEADTVGVLSTMLCVEVWKVSFRIF